MAQTFILVASVSEVPASGILKVRLEGHPIVLTSVGGEIFAVADRCSHEDVPLSLGCIRGDTIKCSYHGSRFSLRTGEPMDEPADTPIAVYPVKLEGNAVLVGIEKDDGMSTEQCLPPQAGGVPVREWRRSPTGKSQDD
ncbi:MAG TPA: non-heme iron oxygenase ferredoxin subunit [Thiobacillaceae bacterium]|nr:non-heme iron oxygenase ferredoxin subunit [Thiobacillaceae bacterium]